MSLQWPPTLQLLGDHLLRSGLWRRNSTGNAFCNKQNKHPTTDDINGSEGARAILKHMRRYGGRNIHPSGITTYLQPNTTNNVPLDAFEVACAPSEPLTAISYWTPLFDSLQKAFRLNYGAMIHCEAGDHRAVAVSAAIDMTIHGANTYQASIMIKIIRKRSWTSGVAFICRSSGSTCATRRWAAHRH